MINQKKKFFTPTVDKKFKLIPNQFQKFPLQSNMKSLTPTKSMSFQQQVASKQNMRLINDIMKRIQNSENKIKVLPQNMDRKRYESEHIKPNIIKSQPTKNIQVRTNYHINANKVMQNYYKSLEPKSFEKSKHFK